VYNLHSQLHQDREVDTDIGQCRKEGKGTMTVMDGIPLFPQGLESFQKAQMKPGVQARTAQGVHLLQSYNGHQILKEGVEAMGRCIPWRQQENGEMYQILEAVAVVRLPVGMAPGAHQVLEAVVVREVPSTQPPSAIGPLVDMASEVHQVLETAAAWRIPSTQRTPSWP
jgi:hypothetical protein